MFHLDSLATGDCGESVVTEFDGQLDGKFRLGTCERKGRLVGTLPLHQ
jgi:hypothetical protein